MRALIIANNEMREEWSHGIAGADLYTEWIPTPAGLENKTGFDVCIDLLFDNAGERMRQLKASAAPVIMVNAVNDTLQQIGEGIVRLNGWPTFLKRPVAEASCNNEPMKEKAADIFARFGRKVEWVPDIPGFITSRVVAAVINEAYFALEENVSSKEEIDIAMKLGTNYPYGPFEWSRKIGLKNIHSLLMQLSAEQKRYKPAALLNTEALA